MRTGIYQRHVSSPKLPPGEAAEYFKKTIGNAAKLPSIHAWLSEWLDCCAEVIRPHVDDAGRTTYVLNLGDGWQGYRLADDLPEQVCDAINCMSEIHVLMEHVGDDNRLTGDLAWVVNGAFRLGRLTEKMQIRDFEPLAVQGKKLLARAAKGGRASKRLTTQQEKMTLEIIRDKQSARVSKTSACVRASAELKKLHGIDVSTKTLLRLLRDN